MAEREIVPHSEDRVGESEEPLGVKFMPVGVQQRSTRDLQKCVKADLHDSIDPELLERLRRQANGGESSPARNGQSASV